MRAVIALVLAALLAPAAAWGVGPGHAWFCLFPGQCGAGEGDCDHDWQCRGGLVCGRRSCAAMHPGDARFARADCCRERTADEEMRDIVGQVVPRLGAALAAPAGVFDAVLKDVEREFSARVKDVFKALAPQRWARDFENLVRAESVEEVQAAVHEARAAGKVLRTVGSQHAPPKVGFGTDHGRPTLHLKLEGALRRVEVLGYSADDEHLYVRAGAGVVLGVEPIDPASTPETSLFQIVDRLGYAFPMTGGITHQTVGGMLMSGTAGGSTKHAFQDGLLSIELVDGTGAARVLHAGTDDFDAAQVSAGLYGVLTHATFKLGKRFYAKGVHRTIPAAESVAADAQKFRASMEENDGMLMLWWPQAGVERVLERWMNYGPVAEAEREPQTHTLATDWDNYLAAAIMWTIDTMATADVPLLKELANRLITVATPFESGTFNDIWWRTLPPDDSVLVDSVLRVQLAEIWCDIEDTAALHAAVAELLAEDADAHAPLGIEIYPAPPSTAWLSPGYGRATARVNLLWWELQKGDVTQFFDVWWSKLLPMFPTARLHLGKHLPPVGKKYGGTAAGPEWFAQAYPKFPAWLAKRAEYDPDQVFVTDYWRAQFGIPAQ
eukprot:TRINITY_DN1134_c0_g2_i1.p1 TRINITY_DN1134_c0_g2~~TRINITY_DN1134_c0_g2_i1.p1  ORF type:complete len:609 (+),score=217.81 TRINITY_DN1134_c0_g2_i1:76-1902(+)